MSKRLDPSIKAQRAAERRKTSSIRVDGALAYIELLNGGVALIDAADVELVAGHGWSHNKVDGKTYVCSHQFGGGKRTYLHRFLVQAPRGWMVDHADLDGLNNRRGNLRVASKAENGANRGANKNNTSGAKGVVRHWRNRNLYVAQIHVRGRNRYLGTFDSREAASAAYFTAAIKQYGQFARAQ
jgi:hypothetical protein